MRAFLINIDLLRLSRALVVVAAAVFRCVCLVRTARRWFILVPLHVEQSINAAVAASEQSGASVRHAGTDNRGARSRASTTRSATTFRFSASSEAGVRRAAACALQCTSSNDPNPQESQDHDIEPQRDVGHDA
jgi:hypothetical protein